MNRIVLPVAAAALAAAGCVERRIAVTSEPPGALVYINDVEVGRTPVETDFTFYGHYDVRVRKEGYEPIATSRKAGAPLYEYPPIDLFAEAFPADISSVVRWHFDLEPKPAEGLTQEMKDALVERAAELRSQIPVPAAPPEPAPAR